MLQQTQVTTVLPYYTRFVAELPDVRALAAASLDRVLALWSGLGYYRRAHYLHAAAREVVARHGGEFPRDAATLATLPGIGRSTAAAIAAFASGECGAILDGNVKRVLARHDAIEGYPGSPAIEAMLWQAAERRLPADDIEAYTQGMMDLGATICVKRMPRCDVCPVADDCRARVEGRTHELPSPRPKKELPQKSVRVQVIARGGELLLEKRAPVGIWAGLWSLPELPLDSNVDSYVEQRFSAHARIVGELAPIQHGFTHFALTLHPVRVAITDWPARAEAPQCVWLARDDALAAALPSPIRKLLRTL